MKGAEVWTSKDRNFVEDWKDVFGRWESVKTVTFLVMEGAPGTHLHFFKHFC